MKKEYVYIVILSLCIVGVVWQIFALLNTSYQVATEENNTINVVENIYSVENTVETSMEEEKISPNSSFALKKYYDECNHFDYEEVELPKELVNLTEQEVEDYYDDWEVEEFANNKLVLCKEIDGYCNQHFVIKLDNDEVDVYRMKTNGDLEKYRDTDISVDYLPENDIEKLKEGIAVYGEGKVSSALEDYE